MRTRKRSARAHASRWSGVKRTFTATAAVLLTTGLIAVTIPSAAFADDGPPITDATTTAVPSDATTPVVVPDASPVVDVVTPVPTTPADMPTAAPEVVAQPQAVAVAEVAPEPAQAAKTLPVNNGPCKDAAKYGYEYAAATNSGAVDVTGNTCGKTLYVTAVSWKYTTNAQWPQARDVVNYYQISAAGHNDFAALVSCGQGDIYASWDSQPEPPAVLNGPNDPWYESFLSVVLKDKGPSPTYVQQDNSCWKPPPPTTQQCEYTDGATVTDLSTMAFEDRDQGHHELVSGGLHIWTTEPNGSLSKSAGYIATDFALKDAGVPALDYTTTSGASAGLNLTLYVNGQWKGNLVYEPLFAKYWINKTIAGLPAGPNPSYQLAYGTLDEILAAYASNGVTDLRIKAVGYSLGSGAVGDGIVNSITAGCTTYTFDRPVVVVPPTPRTNIVVATCGSADIYISNDFTPGDYTTGEDFTAEIYVDGVLVDTVVVPSGTTTSNHYDFAEDSGDHSSNRFIEVKVGDATIGTATAHTDCRPNLVAVTPVVPIFAQPTCTAKDPVFRVPSQPEGVVATSVAPFGVHFAPSEGYTFPVGTQTDYQFTVVQPTDCTTVAPPVTTPAAQPVTVVKTVTTKTVKVATPTARILASTGLDAITIGGLAALIIAIGAGLFIIKTRQLKKNAS